jgi:predicted ATP-grasp superfamily ATP-dependent carboligase
VADRILILGASARAAAASARRAGLTPFAVDLFADRDTQRLCERVERCPFDEYPRGLFDRAKAFPPMPWMYTGGLENYPELVGELARERELWGNGPEVLRQVLDPRLLATTLAKSAAPVVEVRTAGDVAPASGRWMLKPLCGSGGLGVRLASADDLTEAVKAGSDSYLQRHIPGESRSALFTWGERYSRFVGVSRQLIGERWLHGRAFQYCGSIGPLARNDGIALGIELYGKRISREVGLSGIWGIDYIATGEEQIPIELNPRYPASAEVFEASFRGPGFHWFRPDQRPLQVQPEPRGTVVGKAVYYTPARLTFPATGPWDESLAHIADVWQRPDFADIPHPGEVIEPGQPVLTILTDADTEAQCLVKLKARAAELDRLFGFPTPEDDPCLP